MQQIQVFGTTLSVEDAARKIEYLSLRTGSQWGNLVIMVSLKPNMLSYP